MKFILGLKIGMAQIFDNEKGLRIPVTLVEAGPCKVLQLKNLKKDGYESVQIGLKPKKENKVKKSEKGKGFKFIKEFRLPKDESVDLNIGDMIDVSIFQENDKIKVSGMSIGKGFQGGVKRWGFSGRCATHGTKHEKRTLGSVGCTRPARVIKGRKMPGRTGYARKTVSNLQVVKVDKENNILAVCGMLPGRKGTLLEIRTK
ncbi:MAG: 50S ribosomal protein L3 [Candidatus Paceibacterota bacterium]|jgi:large subunit ribosomal protein L3|nr:50S ribosomal protein L3 [Candidatus Paceibacterota bacterium]MDD4830791.1 50S ribosomal protein L3 [Candidatus Paceibacterota bacterium]MDD4875287.1 50S ribosomal protein L3 [Candidatus Paceibacterota bacterium]